MTNAYYEYGDIDPIRRQEEREAIDGPLIDDDCHAGTKFIALFFVFVKVLALLIVGR